MILKNLANFRKILTFFALSFVLVPFTFAQSGSITGTITDSKTGDTLPAANVSLQGINRGASTDANGNYEITNISPGTYTLRASFVGYTTKKRQVKVASGETVIDIKLQSSNLSLNEMVVTGYGTVQKSQYTGSVSTVSNEDIEDVPVANAAQSLKGKVTGVNFSASSGAPGAPQTIHIRGISSINAGTGPLYVIDGVPVPNITTGGATSPLSSLSNLSSSDIESVNILKGPAATAPYGARGANGVVVIKTKEGQRGGTVFTASVQDGFSNPAVDGPDVLTGEQWDQYYRDATANDPSNNLSPGEVNSPWDGKTSTDWKNLFRNHNALQQKYGLSARGGNDQTTYYASGNFFTQDGEAIGNDLKKISGKFNISQELNNRVMIRNNLTGSTANQHGVLEGTAYFGNPISNEYWLLPIDPAYNQDGTPNLNLSNNLYNSLYTVKNRVDQRRYNRLINNTDVIIDIVDNLTFKTRFAINFITVEEKHYADKNYGSGAYLGGSLSESSYRNLNYVWKNTMHYKSTINENNDFDFKIISVNQRGYSRYLSSYGEGTTDGLFNLNSVSKPQGVNSSTTDDANLSFTGLLNYSYKDKYILSGSIREEADSRFSKSNRWGTFWSASGAYILTKESFLNDISWLNFLKVRASYGKTGNASIGLNQYQSTVSIGSYNNQTTILTGSFGNKDLTWENQKEFDAAIDFETLESRLNGSVTFYRKNSYNLLFSVPLSRTTGQASQRQNFGRLYNQGFEFELNGVLVQNDIFSWNLGGNLSINKNEVTELPKDPNGNPRGITGSLRYTAAEGYPAGAYYTKEWAGVDPENGDPLWYIDDDNGGRTTTNNYNKADSYYQGASGQPTKLGGLNTDIHVFGFSVKANLYYSFGNKIYDTWANYLQDDGTFLNYNQFASQANYWEKPGDHVDNPKPIYGGNKNSNALSTRYLYDGDYLRLSTLRIGYDIPPPFVNKLGLKSLNIYFIGQNLWTYTFDDDLVFDPVVNSSVHSSPLRSLIFGAKIKF